MLALPVMIRDDTGHGQIAYQTLPNTLPRNVSLVTKSCIARFFDDDASNPSALSDCSTGPSPPLVHAESTLSPFQANAGCPRADLFSRFRSISSKQLIAVEKFEHNEKDHLSTFSKLGFRVPRCNKNVKLQRAFVNSLPFFAFQRASAV